MSLVTKYYQNLSYISGPLVFLKGGSAFPYGSELRLHLPNGEEKRGHVLEVSRDYTLVQVLESTSGIGLEGTTVSLKEAAPMVELSPEMIGRVFSGSGQPIDGLGSIGYEEKRDINGSPVNPAARLKPDLFIETGISAIDGFNTLVRGQKLPVFSGSGLPANEIVSFILENARLVSEDEDDELLIIFAAIGITYREYSSFMESIERSKSKSDIISFINLAGDPPIERMVTPRYALATAEYFAFTHNKHVLVVLTDITNYCEALREVSAAREEIPGRRGYPGFMYTDLASLYERAGIIQGSSGSITQLPVLTMPEDDITHPIIDLTGYITEGQLVLSRRLHMQGIFPPIDVLPSLSRLMNNGIGKEKTREDHRQLIDQLYASYANGIDVRKIASIVGEEALSELDKKYLKFADDFETAYINQQLKRHSITDTLDGGWALLKDIPASELTRINKNLLNRYFSPLMEEGKQSPFF